MDTGLAGAEIGFVFLCCSIIAFTAYMRIVMVLHAVDAGLENPPERPHLGDRLRAYKTVCLDRGWKPVWLYVFAGGVAGAFLSWLPLPWLIFR